MIARRKALSRMLVLVPLLLGSRPARADEVPAEAQRFLAAFQARGWPRCVKVRLPMDSGVSPKMRLHEAVKNLNRSVRPHLCIHQEGNGNRVSWEPLE